MNSAFGIWLLSSVIVAAILSIVSEEQRCYSTALSAIPKIARSASERDLRIVEIAAVLHSDKPEAQVQEEISKLVNGSTYFYREYKEKTMLDLESDVVVGTLEIYNLGQKERPEPPSLSSKILDIPDILQLSSLSTTDRQSIISKLRNQWSDVPAKADMVSDFRSFPYVLRETNRQLEPILEDAPCQPFYLIRDRIKQYFHGLQ